MRNISIYIICVFFYILSGCTTHPVITEVHQTKIVHDDTEYFDRETYRSGMEYYLPKVNMLMTFTRKVIPSDNVKKTADRLEKAKENLKKAENALKTAKVAEKVAKGLVVVATPENSGSHGALAKLKRKYEKKVADRQAKEKKLEKDKLEVEEAQDAFNLAKSMQETALSKGQDGSNKKLYVDSIQLKTLPAIADTKRLFIAKLDHSAMRSDGLKIQTNESGLLQSTNAEIEDKTADIIIEVAKIGIAAFKAASFLPTASTKNLPNVLGLSEDKEKKKEKKIKKEKTVYYRCLMGIDGRLGYKNLGYGVFFKNDNEIHPVKIEIEFDPTNLEEISDINEMLCRYRSHLEIEVNPEINSESKLKSQTTNQVNEQRLNGIAYRRPITYLAKVNQVFNRNLPPPNKVPKAPLKSTRVMLPNNGPFAVFPYETDPCTTAKYDVAFNNGMPTRRDIERPSEVLGCLRVPLEILEAIISLPTEILQLKVDYSSNEKEILENQKASFEALNILKGVQESSGNRNNETTE